MANRKNTFLLKRSNITNKIPTLGNLELGEVALNTADAKLFSTYTGGLTGATEIREIGWDRLSTISGGTVDGNVNINGVLSACTGINTSNIYSCSPLNINPNDEGNVYFGSTSGLTIDVVNSRVGIGTTSPTSRLTVVDGGGVEVKDSDVGFNGRVRVGSQNDDGWPNVIGTTSILNDDWSVGVEEELGEAVGLTARGNDPLYLATNLTPRLAVLGTGDIGIGTTSPTSKLDVNGILRVRDIPNEEGNFITKNNSGVLTQRTPLQVLSDIGAQESGVQNIVTTDTVTTNTTITNQSTLLVKNTTSVTITLPSPVDGKKITIKDANGNSSFQFITIDGDGNDIDDEPTYILRNNYKSVTLVGDGNNWFII